MACNPRNDQRIKLISLPALILTVLQDVSSHCALVRVLDPGMLGSYRKRSGWPSRMAEYGMKEYDTFPDHPSDSRRRSHANLLLLLARSL